MTSRPPARLTRIGVAVGLLLVVAVLIAEGGARPAAAVALVALTGWLLVHLRVLTRPVVVSAWPDAVVRAAVAGSLGLTVAGLLLAAVDGRAALDEYASRPPSQRGRRRPRPGPATPAS
jgi:hypothetical protein